MILSTVEWMGVGFWSLAYLILHIPQLFLRIPLVDLQASETQLMEKLQMGQILSTFYNFLMSLKFVPAPWESILFEIHHSTLGNQIFRLASPQVRNDCLYSLCSQMKLSNSDVQNFYY